MRQLFVAGNWKMNLDADTSRRLVMALRESLAEVDSVRVAVGPPYVYLQQVAEALAGSNIGVAAQNMYVEDQGAYTGEISGQMLLDVGCDLVILGHSERRHVMGEGDEFINRKVLKALEIGLEPILCLGELLEQRKEGRTEQVVSDQLRAGLEGVSAGQMDDVVIAYEPVWAIGTGETATPEQAEEVHALLREVLAEVYGHDVAAKTAIQYGGSVKPHNAADLMGMPNVDGALVGGASLEADPFVAIVQAASAIEK